MNSLKIQTLILGLILLLSGHSLFAAKFRTSDGATREVAGKDLENLKNFSVTIKNFFMDVGEHEEMPLPNISSTTLDLILNLMMSALSIGPLQPFEPNNPTYLDQRDRLAQWLSDAQHTN